MAKVSDDMKEDLDYSSLLNSLNSNYSEDAPSLEDITWADSCLNKDVDSSNADWSSIKEALLEIFISQHEPSSSDVLESSRQPTDAEMQHYRDNVTSLKFSKGSDVGEGDLFDVVELRDTELSEDDEDEKEDDVVLRMRRKHVRAKGKGHIGNVFQTNYSDDAETVEKLDSGLDLGVSLTSTSYDLEPSTEEIFKVWDLGVSDEIDDLTEQLNKALTDFPQQSQTTVDDSISGKEFMNVSIDELIAGVGGLSLMQNTE